MKPTIGNVVTLLLKNTRNLTSFMIRAITYTCKNINFQGIGHRVSLVEDTGMHSASKQ